MTKKVFIILIITLCCFGIEAKEPSKGYRGFVDMNTELYITSGFRISSDGSRHEKVDTYLLYGLSTTHGYQFNNHFFLGGGIGLQSGAFTAAKYISGVFFMQTRTDWTFGTVPLYADIRLGGTLFGQDIDNGIDKLLIAPAIGYHLDILRRIKFNVRIGLSLHGCDKGFQPLSHYTWKPFPTLGVGIEF